MQTSSLRRRRLVRLVFRVQIDQHFENPLQLRHRGDPTDDKGRALEIDLGCRVLSRSHGDACHIDHKFALSDFTEIASGFAFAHPPGNFSVCVQRLSSLIFGLIWFRNCPETTAFGPDRDVGQRAGPSPLFLLNAKKNWYIARTACA